ncbi:MAG: hypothetical protein OCD76_01770 [Reichenbachiella sp.]
MEFSFDKYQEDKKLFTISGEPLCYQSEYLNLHLQKGLEESFSGLDLTDILVTTAQELSFTLFTKFFKNKEKLSKELVRKQFVQDFYAHCGFGRIELTSIQPKGGYIDAVSEHYAMTYATHFGTRTEEQGGVANFTLGFLCGAVEAIFEVAPGTFKGKQLKCLSKGEGVCRFEIFRGLSRKIHGSPSLGNLQSTDTVLPELVEVSNGTSVLEGIMSLNLSGTDNKQGLIDQFDMHLTKHFANYFSMVQIKLLMQAKKNLGAEGMKKVKTFLIKLGEGDAYYTVGKLLNSDYWKEYVDGEVGKDRASILSACLDIKTSFGCGKWRLIECNTRNFKVNVVNNPDTNAFLKLIGNTKSPINFYMSGFLIGVANMLEKGCFIKTGVDNRYVDEFLNTKHSFGYLQENSRMVGDEYDTLLVGRS